jgi:enoyl-CoA hydratase/carnithine racemase
MLELVLHERVARLTLARPPVNAINREWLAAFHRQLDELAGRDDWQVLHVRSNQKVFCAGADLAEMRQRFLAADVDSLAETAAAMQRLLARIEALPQVTLAEIGGAALGGGLELALACDLRLAAAEAGLGLPEVQLGLVPGAGGTQRLTHLLGRGIASRLILGGEVVDGTAAEALGLVQWAVPGSEIAARAARKAQELAELPGSALAACKACISAAGDPGRDGFAEELAASRRLYGEAQTRERVQAFLARSTQAARVSAKEYA